MRKFVQDTSAGLSLVLFAPASALPEQGNKLSAPANQRPQRVYLVAYHFRQLVSAAGR